MRAQLRTYHSIPALQAHQDAQAYKQLQDAPRLKSILKGAQEDAPQPQTIEDMLAHAWPRTNVVNLIFCLSTFSPKVAELHFPDGQDFFDLIMKSSYSSESRARAFLWLMWWYSESTFTHGDVERNPFGAGSVSDTSEYESNERVAGGKVRVPPLEPLTAEQEAQENVDTPEEKKFGEDKRKERIEILNSEPSAAMTAMKRVRERKGLLAGAGAGTGDEDGGEAGWESIGPRLHRKTQLFQTIDRVRPMLIIHNSSPPRPLCRDRQRADTITIACRQSRPRCCEQSARRPAHGPSPPRR